MNFQYHAIYVILDKGQEKPIFSSERMLHKDYDQKGSVEIKMCVVMGQKELSTKTNRLAVNRQ
jgi:hypothetical protein